MAQRSLGGISSTLHPAGAEGDPDPRPPPPAAPPPPGGAPGAPRRGRRLTKAARRTRHLAGPAGGHSFSAGRGSPATARRLRIRTGALGGPTRARRRPRGRGSRSPGALSAPRALGAASSFLRRGDARLPASSRKAAFPAARPPAAKDGAHRPPRGRAAAAFVPCPALRPSTGPPPRRGAPDPDPKPRSLRPRPHRGSQDPDSRPAPGTPDQSPGPGLQTPEPQSRPKPGTSVSVPANGRGVPAAPAPAPRTPPGRGRKTRPGGRPPLREMVALGPLRGRCGQVHRRGSVCRSRGGCSTPAPAPAPAAAAASVRPSDASSHRDGRGGPCPQPRETPRRPVRLGGERGVGRPRPGPASHGRRPCSGGQAGAAFSEGGRGGGRRGGRRWTTPPGRQNRLGPSPWPPVRLLPTLVHGVPPLASLAVQRCPTALSHGWPAPASSAVPSEWPRGALLSPRDPSPCRLASSLLWAGAASLPRPEGWRGPGEPGPVSPQTERLTAEQVKEYEGVFEMFDEEGNGAVKTDELERLMSLLGINPTKSELASMAKDVDRDSEAGRGSGGASPGCECGGARHPHSGTRRLLPAGRGFFNCDSFLALMGVSWEKAQNQETELRAAFRIFDKEGKGYIDWDTLKYVLMNAGEPLSELEAEQMMKEAGKDGDGTIDYEGERGVGPGSPAAGSGQAADLSLGSQSSWP
eukprot:XP_028340104.1 calmodulin-like protein 6 [Physeter catodon]